MFYYIFRTSYLRFPETESPYARTNNTWWPRIKWNTVRNFNRSTTPTDCDATIYKRYFSSWFPIRIVPNAVAVVTMTIAPCTASATFPSVLEIRRAFSRHVGLLDEHVCVFVTADHRVTYIDILVFIFCSFSFTILLTESSFRFSVHKASSRAPSGVFSKKKSKLIV